MLFLHLFIIDLFYLFLLFFRFSAFDINAVALLLSPFRTSLQIRYCILASKPAAQAPDEKSAAKVILEIIELEAEKYRLGHTKAGFFWLPFSVWE